MGSLQSSPPAPPEPATATESSTDSRMGNGTRCSCLPAIGNNKTGPQPVPDPPASKPQIPQVRRGSWPHDQECPVVDTDKVISRRGAIPITGRLITTRPLHDDFNVQAKVLGSGMSGPVRLATSNDGTKHAIKSFRKRGLSMAKRRELQNEVEIYLQLDHPHIARLEFVYDFDEELHMVMEFMEGGELYDRLAAHKMYTEELAATTTWQMLLPIHYLHQNKIVHRDLKLENFLYERKDSQELKLIDFGFAKFWRGGQSMHQACGSVHYVAPEVLAHSYTEKADCWSIGIIVYMLLIGSPPFHGSDDVVLEKIKTGKPQWSSRFPKLSKTARSFIQALLVKDPDERMSIAACLEHPWVKDRARQEVEVDLETVRSLRTYAHATHFKRACLSMMAWSLSREDREHLREQFKSMDENNDGTITLPEFKKILVENFDVDSHEAERLFESLDADNDHQLSYTEYLAAALQGRIAIHEDLVRDSFQRFDRDRSGMITVTDLRQVLGKEFEGIEVENILSEAVGNKEAVSYDDFLAYLQAPPQSTGELPEHLERMEKVIDTLMDESPTMRELLKDPTSPHFKPKPLSRKFSGEAPSP
mmetsp:Transcript_39683/g.88847  ORF Transcript_39683/g.88847 Transcript_39683/m.88847 type:complete len:590 (-) Transcript_39683:41-1810(-)